MLEFAFERYFQTTALMGTPDSCSAMVNRLAGRGRGRDCVSHRFRRGARGRDSRFARHQYVARALFHGGPRGNLTPMMKRSCCARLRNPPLIRQRVPNELIDYLKGQVAEALETSPDTLSPDKHVMELGLDSIMVIQLIGDLQRVYGIRLHPREVFEHPDHRRAGHVFERSVESSRATAARSISTTSTFIPTHAAREFGGAAGRARRKTTGPHSSSRPRARARHFCA
jgi:acyl carrier protein